MMCAAGWWAAMKAEGQAAIEITGERGRQRPKSRTNKSPEGGQGWVTRNNGRGGSESAGARKTSKTTKHLVNLLIWDVLSIH